MRVTFIGLPVDFTQTERKVSQKSVSSHPNPGTSWRGLMEFDEAFMQMYRRPSSTTFLVKWSSRTRVIRISRIRYINQAFEKKKNQNDFYRPGILVAIIKQTTYLIFPYLLLRYEISVVQVKYSKMINYKLSIRQYVRSLYSLSSRNHLFEKKKMKNRKHVKYIIRYSDLFFFHLSRENFPTLEFLSFFFFSYFVISLEKNFFITDHVKTWIFHTLKFPCISYHYETTYWNFKSLSKWYSIDKKGKNK